MRCNGWLWDQHVLKFSRHETGCFIYDAQKYRDYLQQISSLYTQDMPKTLFLSGIVNPAIVTTSREFFDGKVELFHPLHGLAHDADDQIFTLAFGLALRGLDDDPH